MCAWGSLPGAFENKRALGCEVWLGYRVGNHPHWTRGGGARADAVCRAAGAAHA